MLKVEDSYIDAEAQIEAHPQDDDGRESIGDFPGTERLDQEDQHYDSARDANNSIAGEIIVDDGDSGREISYQIQYFFFFPPLFFSFFCSRE